MCIRHSSSNNQQLKEAKMRQKKWEKWQELVGCDGSLPYRRTQLFFLTEVLISSFFAVFHLLHKKKKRLKLRDDCRPTHNYYHTKQLPF